MDQALPFRAEIKGGILVLTLDTPGSHVNILSVTAANQLVSLLSEVSLQSTKAVVLQSGKRRSFVNGVGLLLANAVKTREDAARLTVPVRNAYAALRALEVPTIALIRGSCYGCGVELALQCRYRVAVDVGDTELYMTEIADYLFVPVFGSTRDLPQLVGLGCATDLLLWGERMSAQRARAVGLVDACISAKEAEGPVARLVDRTLRGESGPFLKPDDLDAVARRTRDRISMLPPDYRPVYSSCFELLERSARCADDEATARAREVEACGQSAMTEVSKAAQSFFFVRQIADSLCSQRTAVTGHTSLTLMKVAPLSRALAKRTFDDVEVIVDPDELGLRLAEKRETRGFRLASFGHEGDADARVTFDPFDALTEDGVCFVFDGDAPRAFEIAATGDEGAALYAVLARTGLVGITSRAEGRFVSATLLDAFCAPLDAHARLGGDARRAARALRDFGFVSLPSLLAQRALHGPALLEPVSDDVPEDPDVMPAVLLSLLAWAHEALRAKVLTHVSVVDVLAYALLGFPVGRGSLGRYLRIDRARAALARADALTSLVEPSVLTCAEEYVRHGQAFYR